MTGRTNVSEDDEDFKKAVGELGIPGYYTDKDDSDCGGLNVREETEVERRDFPPIPTFGSDPFFTEPSGLNSGIPSELLQ